MAREQRMYGRVSSIHKSFCFITGDDGIDRFAHAAEFGGRENFETIEQHQKVEFTSTDGVKGPRALAVKIV